MAPDLLPVLSRGRHRNPKRGACLMELASLLAGERFSDHPKCAHPVLAAVARSVNDCTTDEGRPALAPLATGVIDTAGDDPRIGPLLVRLCSRRALARGETRGRFVVAVGLLAAQHQLDRLDGRPPSPAEEVLGPVARRQEVADAARFVRGVRASSRYYRRRGAQEAAVCAVLAMASGPGPSGDAALRSLLEDAITLTRGLVPTPVVDAPPTRPTRAKSPDEPAVGDAGRWDWACSLVGPAGRSREE
ncbi:MAG: hypothetical protein ACRDYU_07155 [Actinomycetes bacterium]